MRKHYASIMAGAAVALLAIGMWPALSHIPDAASVATAFEREVFPSVPHLLTILLGTCAGLAAFASTYKV